MHEQESPKVWAQGGENIAGSNKIHKTWSPLISRPPYIHFILLQCPMCGRQVLLCRHVGTSLCQQILSEKRISLFLLSAPYLFAGDAIRPEVIWSKKLMDHFIRAISENCGGITGIWENERRQTVTAAEGQSIDDIRTAGGA